MSISQISQTIKLKKDVNINKIVEIFDSIMCRSDWTTGNSLSWTSDINSFDQNDIWLSLDSLNFRFRIDPSTDFEKYIQPIQNIIDNYAEQVSMSDSIITDLTNFDLLQFITNTNRYQKYLKYVEWQKTNQDK
jgi:hypothetical protein